VRCLDLGRNGVEREGHVSLIVALLVGLFLGANVGFVIAAVLVSGKRADQQAEAGAELEGLRARVSELTAGLAEIADLARTAGGTARDLARATIEIVDRLRSGRDATEV
jgi:flagellar basal body-associated protein FliL